MSDGINLIYNGGFSYLLKQDSLFLPMGIFQLKSYLEKKGLESEVEFLSKELLNNSKNKIIFRKFFVENNLRNLENWQNNIIDENILQIIKDQIAFEKNNNKFWGFSISCFEDILPTLYAILALKNYNNNFVAIVGGSYMKYLNIELIKDNHDLIDFLVVGDGEYALCKILNNDGDKQKLKDTDNLVFFDNGRLISNPVRYLNFKDILLPDYEIVMYDEEIYYNFSRGCGGQCVFCTSKDKLQFKDFTTICKEIDSLLSRYNPNKIYFIDCSANNNVQLFVRILEFLHERNEVFEAIFWVDFFNFPDILIEAINDYTTDKKLNLKFGLESGDKKMRDFLNKPRFTNDAAINIIKKLKSKVNNLKINLNIIVSIPYEDKYSFVKTIKLISDLKDFVSRVPITVFHLTPESALFENPNKFKIRLRDRAVNKYNYYFCYDEIDGLTWEDIERRNYKYFEHIVSYLNKAKISW